MARFPKSTPVWGRLIHQPHVNKVGATLTVSSTEGIVRPRVPKRDRPAYRAASDLKWGDALLKPVDEQP